MSTTTHTTELIIATFPTIGAAAGAERNLRAADEQLESIALGHIAIVSKNDESKVDIDYTADPDTTRRTLFGSVAAIVFGGLFGGLVGAALGALGGYGAKVALEHIGLKEADLGSVSRALEANHSAVVVLVKPEEQPIVVAELERLGGSVTTHSLTPEALAAAQAKATPGETVEAVGERLKETASDLWSSATKTANEAAGVVKEKAEEFASDIKKDIQRP
jgi:uncharacterized membrane protein